MPEEKVEVVRRGGIAGVTARAAVDRASLSPEVAAALDAVLSGRVRATPAAGRADMFTYEFASGQGAARRSARVAEHDLPPELHALLQGVPGGWHLG